MRRQVVRHLGVRQQDIAGFSRQDPGDNSGPPGCEDEHENSVNSIAAGFPARPVILPVAWLPGGENEPITIDIIPPGVQSA